MKRFLKWSFGLLFLLVILVVGAIIALPYLIDPNEYKDEIIAQVKPHLKGRDLKIPGDIRISVFPWLGFEIGETVIGNAQGFVLKPFMTIEHAQAHIRVMSLFTGEPEIGSLTLDGIKVNLQQDAEGRNNWSDLAQIDNAASLQRTAQTDTGFIKVANTTKAPAPAAAAKNDFTLPPLKIAGLHLTNVQVELDDKRSKDVITLSKLNVDAGPIDRFNPVPIKGKFNFHSKKNEISAASAFASTLAFTARLDDFTLQQFVINTNLTGKPFNDNTIKTSLKVPALNVKTAEQLVTAKPFTLRIDDIDSEGRFSLKRFDKPVVRLGWEISKLDLDKLMPPSTEPASATQKKEEQVAIPEIAEMVSTEGIVQDNSAQLFAPLLVFANSDMQGTITIGELIVRRLQFKNVKVNLLARSGLVSALPSAELYDGKYSGDLQIQTAKKQPTQLRSKQKLENVPLGPIVKALYGKESVTGRLNFQGQFFSSGDAQKTIIQNLNGDGQFNIRDTEVKTLDVKQLILKKYYDKLDFVKEKEEDKEVTVFETVRGTIRIKAGVASNKDFNAISRRVHLKGNGYADLNEETVRYTLTAVPKKSMAFNLAGHHYDLKDKDINTTFIGPWSNIDISNDLGRLLKDEFRQTGAYKEKHEKEEKVKQEIADEKEKLKSKLDELKDKLKNRK